MLINRERQLFLKSRFGLGILCTCRETKHAVTSQLGEEATVTGVHFPVYLFIYTIFFMSTNFDSLLFKASFF